MFKTKESREDLRKILKDEKIVIVTFKKTNGDERVMSCTLNPEIVPERTEERKQTYTPNPEVCAVWDLANEGWRSFRYDGIVKVSLDPNE